MTDTISTEFGDVLAATATEVVLRGRRYTGPKPVDCVVHVTRELYFAAVASWLDHKAVYFKAFCGVGTIEFEQLTQRPERMCLQTDDGTVANVLAYDAARFVVDMEHG